MLARTILFVALIGICESVHGLIVQTVDPQIRTHLAVEAVNGGNTELRAYDHSRGYVRPALIIFYVAVGAVLFWPRSRSV